MQKQPNIVYKHYYMPYEIPAIAELGNVYTAIATGTNYIFHNYLELGLCQEGSGILVIDDTEYAFSAGDVTVVSPFVMHYNYTTAGLPCRCEYLKIDVNHLMNFISDEFLRKLRNTLYSPESFNGIIRSDQNTIIPPLVQTVLSELQQHAPYYETAIQSYSLALLTACQRFSAEEAVPVQSLSTKMLIRRAIVYINEHYSNEIHNSELAELCNMSETHFCRLFRELIGTTPYNYTNRIRIHAACAQLYSGSDNIKQIAQNVGFGSLSSFNRNFQSVMGSSPSQWIREAQTAADNPSILYVEPEEAISEGGKKSCLI